ncbi:hypothetical protein F4553_005256 [Allocatelliglobosispora scoriae]|uniref:ApeA N-terminal domain-containing protein n=1 Tax=Allocatelliglobosispora scoriae TaxID=643052 RepID=A0A841BS51_9ACTN|nr:hypothetical protein [Allocatelliglobosispora scoriae]MBB5871877.1 hypothetical protein [Allocatelliglobosispora scoriae]
MARHLAAKKTCREEIDMDVRASYELPVPIWVMGDALDATYPTGYGKLWFNVVMPHGQPPVGGPPPMLGVESRPELTGEQVVWVKEYGAFIPESLRPATALHRVAVTDAEGPTYDHKPWFTAEHQLAGCIGEWFNDVRTWAEIVTGQDLDPDHRVYSAESVGAGLTFIEPPRDGALGFKITTPSVVPLRAQEWASILGFVRDGQEPPLEEVLSRDARAAHRRGANRRAIIDAATALEIVLVRHVRSHASQLPQRQRDRIGERAALGVYLSIAENSGLPLAVPADRLRWLTDLRNDAAHRGAAPDHVEAGNAVQVMIDFLGAHGRLRRTDEREPDGGELMLADPETASLVGGEARPHGR